VIDATAPALSERATNAVTDALTYDLRRRGLASRRLLQQFASAKSPAKLELVVKAIRVGLHESAPTKVEHLGDEPPVVFGPRVRSRDLGHLHHAEKHLEPMAADCTAEPSSDLGPKGRPEEIVDGLIVEERAHETWYLDQPTTAADPTDFPAAWPRSPTRACSIPAGRLG
jgi:hypothetical protein